MIRVKDPARSLDFYTKALGFTLIWGKDFPQWGFSVYFLALLDSKSGGMLEKFNSISSGDWEARWKFCCTTPGCVELTWNHGSEKEEKEKIYNTGNADTTGTNDGEKVKGGFGHLGITVPDVYEACERFHKMGVRHRDDNVHHAKIMMPILNYISQCISQCISVLYPIQL